MAISSVSGQTSTGGPSQPSRANQPEIVSQAVASGAHALVLVDQAGWHQSKKLVAPANITLMPLPAKAPELNPVENIWQTVCSFLKRRWLVPRYAANEGCAG